MNTCALYYWPDIPGRGEFVRLVLEAAAVPYRDVAREEGVEAIVEAAGFKGVAHPHQPFAPPWLTCGEITVFQTANICAWLGERHGLAPKDEADRRFALGVALTIEDLVREVHDTHHPVAVSLYYEDQRDVAIRRAADFRTNRLPTFLRYFEGLLEIRGTSWLTGPDMTYCDLGLFQLHEGLNYAFPNAMQSLRMETERFTNLAARVAETPRLAAYLSSPRRLPFNQSGIFRNYPELDGGR